MAETLLKDKNDEIYENFETDDNKEEKFKRKASKPKLKLLILVIVFSFIFAGLIYYKYFQNFSNSLNLKLLEKYSELGKKDENLQLDLSTEFFIERTRKKYLNVEAILHFNKDDIDKNRLLRAIKMLIENQTILQSIFFKKMVNII